MNKYFKKIIYYMRRPLAVYRCIFGEYSPKIKRMNYDEYWETRGSFGFSTRYPVFAEVIENNSSIFNIV